MTDFAALAATFEDDVELFNAWLLGPASGAGSTVEIDGDDVKTPRRIQAEAEALGAVSSTGIVAGAIAFDLAVASNRVVAFGANITSVTFANEVEDRANTATLLLTGDGNSRTYAGLTSCCTWLNGSPAPSTTNNKRNLYNFFTFDEGTTWFGTIVAENF